MYICMYLCMYIYLPFSFLLFLKEVTYKTRRIVDMANVMVKKSPKQVAKPIIGPEGCGSKANTTIEVCKGCFNICNEPSIMRTPFCEHEHNMNSNSGISLLYVYKDSKDKIQADQECGVLRMCVYMHVHVCVRECMRVCVTVLNTHLLDQV